MAVMSAEQLRRVLRRTHDLVDQEHRALTATWRGPLSLFDERAERAAAGKGVPAWAIATASKARRLVDESSCLEDLTNVYEAQIVTAKKEGRELRRDPLSDLLERLDRLAARLQTQRPYLQAAREAFDSANRAAAAGTVLAPSSQPAPGGGLEGPGAGHAAEEEPEAPPVVIIRPTGFRDLWRGFSKGSKEYMVKALEATIDVVTTAGYATGLATAHWEASAAAKESTSSSKSEVGQAAAGSRTLPLRRVPWSDVTGAPSAWLNLEDRRAAHHVRTGPLLASEAEEEHKEGSQNMWERCRRRGDRRWTLC